MKITAQEEYGIRCILQLAREEASGPEDSSLLQVRDIAEREGLSVAYVEKILWTLSRSGIVESIRGPKGGYKLSRSCSEISIGEILRAFGGLPSKEDICSQFTGNNDTCVHHDGCGLRPVWASITDFVHSVFDKIPISALLDGAVDIKLVQLTGKNTGANAPQLPVKLIASC